MYLDVPLPGCLLDLDPEKSGDEKDAAAQDLGKEMR